MMQNLTQWAFKARQILLLLYQDSKTAKELLLCSCTRPSAKRQRLLEVVTSASDIRRQEEAVNGGIRGTAGVLTVHLAVEIHTGGVDGGVHK